jgi:predicted Zn-dependent protease with MMP-like domain
VTAAGENPPEGSQPGTQPRAPHQRRDRRGRGIRGPLAPPAVPLSRTRAAAFDELVLDAVEHLEHRWADQLSQIQFAVEDVPPASLLGRNTIEPVPLGAWFAASGGRPGQIVIYRRPIEARSTGLEELAELVHDVVVEKVAEFLGLDPEAVDPGYGEGWEPGSPDE